MHDTHLILASASPQRRTLLAGLGLSFQVMPSDYDESQCTEPDPVARAVLLARKKAENIAWRNRGCAVLGCDTLVVAQEGTLLEKPASAADARRMLRLQSGGTSVVHSALCLIDADGRAHEGLSSSNVVFRTLLPADIEWWIGTGQWKDRSGSFQIDGLGQLMIERLEGDWTGVVGLPVFVLGQLLRAAKLDGLM